MKCSESLHKLPPVERTVGEVVGVPVCVFEARLQSNSLLLQPPVTAFNFLDVVLVLESGELKQLP
jgi:hypothetical protein